MEKKANIGYFFQKDYYNGLTEQMFEEKSSQAVVFFNAQNGTLIDSSKITVKPDFQIDDENILTFELKTIYPGLITGIGMVHETGMLGEAKLGLAFDYTSGLPYIPGSSVKGLLRSMFPIVSTQSKAKTDEKTKALRQEKREYVCEILKSKYQELAALQENEMDELAKLIFEGETKEKKFLPIYERDIFFDAQIEGDYRKKGILGFDYITPHKDELRDPNPIKFLKIMPEVKFRFCFRLGTSTLSSGIKVTAQHKLYLFKEILTTVGIGAKTNVGYGQLKPV